MNNIIKALKILEEKKEYITPFITDGNLHRDLYSNKVLGQYEGLKTVTGWICYELDKDNYPTNYTEYIGYNSCVHLATVLGITTLEATKFSFSSYIAARSLLVLLAKEYLTNTELIKYISILGEK